MTDYQPNAEAIEKAAIVLCATDRQESIWAILDESERNAFRTDATAALSAAYPAIRAQIIRELADEAERDMADSGAVRAALPEDAPFAAHARQMGRYETASRVKTWLNSSLRARLDQTKETR